MPSCQGQPSTSPCCRCRRPTGGGGLRNEGGLTAGRRAKKNDEAVAADDAIDEADYAKADIAEANEVDEAICNSKTIGTVMKLKSDATTNRDIAEGHDCNDHQRNDATANKADVADKPAEAVEAEAYEANVAEADEADEAILDDAANEAIVANKAADSDDEADDAVESDAANDADSADKVADAAETTEADKADVANYAIVADDVNGAAVLYSLAKYSAIFAEVKGYFGITVPDNQLGRRSSCSLRSKNQYQLDNQLEVVVEKGLV